MSFAFPVSPKSSQGDILDPEFEFDAPHYCDLTALDAAEDDEKWFENSHSLHEPIEKRPESQKKKTKKIKRISEGPASKSFRKSIVFTTPKKGTSHSYNSEGRADSVESGDEFDEPKNGPVKRTTRNFSHDLEILTGASRDLSLSPSKPLPQFFANTHTTNKNVPNTPTTPKRQSLKVPSSPGCMLTPQSRRALGGPKRINAQSANSTPRTPSSKRDSTYYPVEKENFDSQDEHVNTPVKTQVKEKKRSKTMEPNTTNINPSSPPTTTTLTTTTTSTTAQYTSTKLSKGGAVRVLYKDEESENSKKRKWSDETKELMKEKEKERPSTRMQGAIVSCPAPAEKRVKESKSTGNTTHTNTSIKKNAKLSKLDIDDSLAELLSAHNKKFKPQTKYEPRTFSVRDVKMWEEKTGQKWYSLTPAERQEANDWISNEKKRAVSN
eukprot:TRINITY_DN1733_c0_g1_i1.p1 TRINITY_DN1733_c0_g1~~TRINITY_DN1733_c0_g1_i1.p1  ORF type:complete len:438 (+),score=112.46 TRINITY_DN1733_c0_g1_i1:389-1702(+)